MGKGTRDPKRRYFLGIPIARPEDPDPDIVVSSRVADAPRPLVPSIKHACANCQQLVWLDPSTRQYAARGVRVVCTQCFKTIVDALPKN